MITIEKIKHHVPKVIIETIDQCAKLGEIDTLEQWLMDCSDEIERREAKKENVYPLYCEKAYLQTILSK